MWEKFNIFLQRALVSWKTTAPGVVVLLITFGPSLGWISEANAIKLSGVATALGLIQAKSLGVTGGSEQNPSRPETKIR